MWLSYLFISTTVIPLRHFLKKGKASVAEVFIVSSPFITLSTSAAPAGAQTLALSPAPRPPWGVLLLREEKRKTTSQMWEQEDLES